jgi:hypothetical protein
MNYIIFTQDIYGERKWLENQLPNCQNFETIHSKKWPSDRPVDLETNSIWEVPPDFTKNVSDWSGRKIKSLFDPTKLESTNRWLDADDLLFDPEYFSHGPRSNKALVLHVARSGTVLLETILQNHCKYEQISDWGGGPATSIKPGGLVETVRKHAWPYHPNYVSDNGQELGIAEYAIINNQQPDVFFLYRADWWGWITSTIIGNHKGYFHYNDMPDLSSTPLIEIRREDLDQSTTLIKYVFNNLCHMRTVFRNINFYVFEYGDLIKNQSLSDHRKIPYDKKLLFTNYDQMQKTFEEEYLETLNLYRDRFINHVTKMKCQTPTNFNNIYSSNKHD